MSKRVGISSAVIILSMLMCSCGQMPDLDSRNEEMISEYAASLLLKYDSQNHSRLVDTEPFLTTYYDAKMQYEIERNKYYEEKALEEEQRKTENAIQESLGNNSGSTDVAGEGAGDGTGGATVVDNQDIQSFLGYPDFSFSYIGCSLVDSYPEGEEGYFFVISASKGKKLLIAYFDVTNNSSDVVKLDIFNQRVSFKLSVNGEAYTKVVTTMLEDDMSVYLDGFNPGETKRLCLAIEVSPDTEVSSLGISMKKGDDSLTKNLF